MGELLYFAETTLLWMVAVFFLTGIVIRSLFFVVNIFRRRSFSRRGVLHRFVTLVGVFAPFHRAILKKPGYTALRYGFQDMCPFGRSPASNGIGRPCRTSGLTG